MMGWKAAIAAAVALFSGSAITETKPQAARAPVAVDQIVVNLAPDDEPPLAPVAGAPFEVKTFDETVRAPRVFIGAPVDQARLKKLTQELRVLEKEVRKAQPADRDRLADRIAEIARQLAEAQNGFTAERLELAFPNRAMTLRPQDREALEQARREVERTMAELRSNEARMRAMPPLDPARVERLRKEAQRMSEEARRNDARTRVLLPMDPAQVERLRDEAQRMSEEARRNDARTRVLLPMDPAQVERLRDEVRRNVDRTRELAPLAVEVSDLMSIFDSLSEAQWKKHEQNGHLTPSDLTPAQRRNLGNLRGSGWSISLEKDGKRLNLRPESTSRS